MPCQQAADAKDDGVVDISDALYALGFLFLGGAAIPALVGTCGLDPTAHGLPCGAFPG